MSPTESGAPERLRGVLARPERISDEDAEALRVALDGVHNAQLDLQELTIQLQRRYGLYQGDQITRNGRIVRQPET